MPLRFPSASHFATLARERGPLCAVAASVSPARIGGVKSVRLRLVTAAAFTAFTGLAGCTGTSPYMTPGAPSPAAEAVTETATVVFVRPSVLGGAARVTLLDGKGRFLGDTLPGTYFVVKMPPGEHVFVSWGENTSAVKATVAAGKTYYVEAYGPGGPGTPPLALHAVGLRSPNWASVDGWLANSKPLTPDEAKGQEYLQRHAAGVAAAIERGDRALADYEGAEIVAHTLTAEDGR